MTPKQSNFPGHWWCSAILGLAVLSLLVACGGGGGDETGGSSAPSRIIWGGNNNQSTVLDNNGNTWYFSSSSGCMYSTITGIGPSGFCLTSTTSSTTGPTSCVNPSTNTSCDTASFQVTLTKPLAGAGCIAVLAAPVPTTYALTVGSVIVNQLQPLDVTIVSNSAFIQTYKTHPTSGNATAPTAYSAYWNGAIPACGGTNPYEGVYTFQTAATCSSSGPVTNPSIVFAANLTIDSAGSIADDGSKAIRGSIPSNGVGGSLTGAPDFFSGQRRFSSYAITSAVQNGSGKWVMQGTSSLTVIPVGCGTLTATFTATQN